MSLRDLKARPESKAAINAKELLAAKRQAIAQAIQAAHKVKKTKVNGFIVDATAIASAKADAIKLVNYGTTPTLYGDNLAVGGFVFLTVVSAKLREMLNGPQRR